MQTYQWYQLLIKPTWALPAWIFGPVWSALYLIIAFTFGSVFYRAYTGALSYYIALPFLLNLIFNLAFSPIQFGLRNNTLATVDIILVLASLIWAMVAIYPHMKWVVYLNIPYLLWVSFATFLQIYITYLNW